jgi:2-C-methyl-D-erythritol 4-phosphate cytidylyltransferase
MTDLSPLPPPLPDTSAASARFWAVIPCAGTGSRALPVAQALGQAVLPKQYQSVAGQPLVLHTLAAFALVPRIQSTLVAVAVGDRFLDAYPSSSFFLAECGGPTRAETVLGGLRTLREYGAQEQDWVLVHDAARCLITPQQIDALIDACATDSVGGLLAHKLADTLKTSITGMAGLRVGSTLDRSDKWLAQTPQMFRLGLLYQALEQLGPAATDEASAIEALGLHPCLVPGNALNFKITYPEDFTLAEAVLSQRAHAPTLERFGGERGLASDAPPRTIF